MEKRVTLFILINCFFFAAFYISCKKEQNPVLVEYISGEVTLKEGTTQKPLNQNEVISTLDFNSISFHSGFAIFKTDSVRLILPKKGKTTYSFSEFQEEMKLCRMSINQKYLAYITKNIRKKESKSTENLNTQGAVSRGGIDEVSLDSIQQELGLSEEIAIEISRVLNSE